MSISERIPEALYVHLVAMKLTKQFEPPRTPRTQRSWATLIKPTITRFRRHSADGARDLIWRSWHLGGSTKNTISQTHFLMSAA
jgi:hypothetical protein